MSLCCDHLTQLGGHEDRVDRPPCSVCSAEEASTRGEVDDVPLRLLQCRRRPRANFRLLVLLAAKKGTDVDRRDVAE